MSDRPAQHAQHVARLRALWGDSLAWDAARPLLEDMQARLCQTASSLEAHHIVPLHRGGASLDPDNLVTLCKSCHLEVDRGARAFSIEAVMEGV